MKELTPAEWQSKGMKLYGPDVNDWKFECPSCGNIQSVKEFHDLPDAKASDALISCIGRYVGLPQTRRMKASIYSDNKPCLYTICGLFNLAETAIVDEDFGKKWYVFEFADEMEDK